MYTDNSEVAIRRRIAIQENNHEKAVYCFLRRQMMVIAATIYAFGRISYFESFIGRIPKRCDRVFAGRPLNNVCGSPTSTISGDSNSGWPIENFNEFSLSYYNNEYRIFSTK